MFKLLPLLSLASTVLSVLFYRDQVINPRITYVLLRKGHFVPSELDLEAATYRELLALPLLVLKQLSDKQAEVFFRPGRVSYDEHLLLPPTINFLPKKSVTAVLRPVIREALKKKVQLHTGIVLENDKTQRTLLEQLGVLESVRKWARETVYYILEALDRLYGLLVGRTTKAVRLVHQSVMAPLKRSLQVRQVSLSRYLSRLPILPASGALAIRRASLASPKQTHYWRESRSYSKFLHMLLVSLTSTDPSITDDPGTEWIEDLDPLERVCPVHRHPHGANRTYSDSFAPQNEITRKCSCHRH